MRSASCALTSTRPATILTNSTSVKSNELGTKEKPVPSCDKPLEELSAYLDGELGLEETRALQHHLSSCTSCQEKVKVLSLLEEAVTRSAEGSPVPRTLYRYVSSLARPSLWSSLRHAWTMKTALAFVLILAVTSVAGWWWQRGREGKHEELTQVLVATHVHYLQVPDALEISSANPAIITSWFGSRVPFPVRIPQLHDVHLLGGRLCPLLGRQAALVFYECEGKRLSLFTLAGDASLPEEKIQMTNWDNSRCLRSFGKYALCFYRLESVVLVIVTEGPEMEEIAMNLFRSLAE